MKILTVCVLGCALMLLAQATDLLEAKAENNQTVFSQLDKRTLYSVSCCGRRCFYYIPRPMTWAEAERNCVSMGGNLASVHSCQEYHTIQRLILRATHTYKEAWIGGSDAQQTNIWLWSDGSPFHYTSWCQGCPNNAYGRQHCLQINYSGAKCWDDLECYDRRPSVCAKKRW